jgi:hypothetical protein
MNILNWLGELFSERGKALRLYRRGMQKAHGHNNAGAIQDYTALLAMDAAPLDLRAMALYNRALVYVAIGDVDHGAEDLHAVIEMDESAGAIRTMARQKLARMETRETRRQKRAEA